MCGRIKATMQASSPHFLLYSEATIAGARPRWRFVLQAIGCDDRLAVVDSEPETRASRLELLAVVRGLEALDQPSRVTLLTHSRYVQRGIRRELNQWREKQWQWERFGKLVSIRDHDLWQRIDRALQFHTVDCCEWQVDEAPVVVGHMAAEADIPQQEPAVLLVRRPSQRRWRRWSIVETLGRLGHGVLTPISAILPPAFTRAA